MVTWGGGNDQASFVNAVIYNIYALLPPGLPSEIELAAWKPFFVSVFIVLIVLVFVFIRCHDRKKFIITYFPVIILMLYPYFWYGLATQHAQMHPLFTYRNQMLTVMGGWIIVSQCIKWSRTKHK